MQHPGINIKKWREANDWSEGELARRSKVNQPTIHRIESGESKDPKRPNLEAIAKALGVGLEDLYKPSGTNNRAPNPPESKLTSDLKKVIEVLDDGKKEVVLRFAEELAKGS